MHLSDHERTCQSAILQLLTDSYPAPWTYDEILRELATNPCDFSERDLIANGLRDLTSHGILHHHADFYLPTRTAIETLRLDH